MMRSGLLAPKTRRRGAGLDGDIRSIEPGKLADLIVMDRNPLENLRNSTRSGT